MGCADRHRVGSEMIFAADGLFCATDESRRDETSA